MTSLGFRSDSNSWRPIVPSYLSVMDYGAVGDGVADDTSPCRSALAAGMATRQIVLFPKGIYRVTSPLTDVAVVNHLKVRGEGEDSIVFTQIENNAVFVNASGLASKSVLSAIGGVGERTITVVSTAGYVADGYVEIRSTEWAPDWSSVSGLSTLAKKGELNRIRTVVDGTHLLLRSRLEDTYPVGTLVNPVTMSVDWDIRDLTIQHTSGAAAGNAAQRAFAINSTRHLYMENILSIGMDGSTINMSYCVDGTFNNIRGESHNAAEADSVTPYLVIASSGCSNLRFDKLSLRQGRHTFTTGVLTGQIEPAHIVVSDSTAVGCALAGFDTHPGARNVTFDNCEVWGADQQTGMSFEGWGFQLRGRRITAQNCRAWGVEYGAFIPNSEDCVITNCEFGACDIGIRIQNAPNVRVDNILIRDPITSGVEVVNSASVQYGNGRYSDIHIEGNPSTAGMNFVYWNDTNRIDRVSIPEATVKWVGVPPSHFHSIGPAVFDSTAALTVFNFSGSPPAYVSVSMPDGRPQVFQQVDDYPVSVVERLGNPSFDTLDFWGLTATVCSISGGACSWNGTTNGNATQLGLKPTVPGGTYDVKLVVSSYTKGTLTPTLVSPGTLDGTAITSAGTKTCRIVTETDPVAGAHTTLRLTGTGSFQGTVTSASMKRVFVEACIVSADGLIWAPAGDINVLAYGVVADGVADDTAALLNAIGYAAGLGRKALLPVGRMRVTGPILDFLGSGTVQIEGDPVRSILVNEMVAAGNMISVVGRTDIYNKNDIYLTAPAAQGARILTLNDTSQLTANQDILIKDWNNPVEYHDKSYSDDLTRIAALTGEINRIKSIDSSTQITLGRQLEFPLTIRAALTGTVSTTSGSNVVTGVGTAFDTQLVAHNYITIAGIGSAFLKIRKIVSATVLWIDTTQTPVSTTVSGAVATKLGTVVQRFLDETVLKVDGLRVEGSAAVTVPNTNNVFSLNGVRRYTLQDVSFYAPRCNEFTVTKSLRGRLVNYHSVDAGQVGLDAYSIKIANGCRSLFIDHAYAQRPRHLVTTVTDETEIESAWVYHTGCHVDQPIVAAYDQHPGARNFVFTGCGVSGADIDGSSGFGFQMRGRFITMTGCQASAVSVGLYVAFGDHVRVDGFLADRCDVSVKISQSFHVDIKNLVSVSALTNDVTIQARYWTAGTEPLPDIRVQGRGGGNTSGPSVDLTYNWGDDWKLDFRNPDATVKYAAGIPSSHSHGIATKSANFNVSPNLTCIYRTTGTVTATLPLLSGETGEATYTFVKLSGTLIVDGNGAETIDGAVSIAPVGPTNVKKLGETGAWVSSWPVGTELNVKDFGAVGNGTTDDTAAIQAAIAQARNASMALFFPPGRYRCTAPLDNAANKGPLEIYGPNATLLHDFANAVAWAFFMNANGSVGSAVLVTANIVAGQSTVQVASGTGFAAKDYVVIRDKNQPHYGTSTDQVVGCEGEVFRVESVSGNTLTVVGSLEETYTRVSTGGFTNNNVDVRKLTLIAGLNIHDINFEAISVQEFGVATCRVLDLDCYLDARVSNVGMKRFFSDGLRCEFFVDFRFTDIAYEDFDVSGGYGLQVRQGCSGHFVRPVARTIRHVMTTGDGIDEIPPRHVDCIGGRVYGNVAAAYDTHGNGKYIRFIDCQDYSHKTDPGTGDASFQIRCKNSSVINPLVTGGGQEFGVAAYPGATNFTLIGGEIRGCQTGVYISGCDNASVSGTRIWPAAGATDGIRVDRIIGYNVPMVSNHIANVGITGVAASPCTNGINYVSSCWLNGFTLDVDPMRIRNCTDAISGASMAISIADDTVYSVALGTSATSTTGLLLIWCTTNTTVPPSPNGTLRFRVGGSAICNIVSLVNTANIVAMNGVLTGTTGIDGNFTISAHTDGKLYFENRAGSTRVIGIKIIGPA